MGSCLSDRTVRDRLEAWCEEGLCILWGQDTLMARMRKACSVLSRLDGVLKILAGTVMVR